jgi:hypothetical protein
MTPPAEPEAAAGPGVAREQGARAPQPIYSAGSLRPLFVSPRGITRGAAAGLVASTLASWLALGVHLAHLIELRTQLSGSGGDAERLSTIGATLRVAQYVQITVYAITAVLFLAWLFRLRINVRALGVRKLEFARAWSLLGFLVPILNVVRPYQVIAEVWRASDPSVIDSFEWKSVEAPQFLALWWGTFVIAVTLELAAFGLHLTAGAPAFESAVASSVAIVADLAAAVSASLGFFLVNRLCATQIEKHERLRDEAERA